MGRGANQKSNRGVVAQAREGVRERGGQLPAHINRPDASRPRGTGTPDDTANPADPRTGPNPRWLARAKLFELPGKLCKRGHDISKEGTYRATVKRKGKTWVVDSCRRCRIEDVQNWRDRHEWAA